MAHWPRWHACQAAADLPNLQTHPPHPAFLPPRRSVELAAELHDLVTEDVARTMPGIKVGRPLHGVHAPRHWRWGPHQPAGCLAARCWPSTCPPPSLTQDDVSITLVDGMDSLLSSYHT